MSIIAFVGLPGSGKTYGVVENVILKAFADGRHVVTNIPLNRGVVYTEYPDAEITVIKDIEAELGQREIIGEEGKPEPHAPGFKRLPPGAIVILDEVWRIWPSGLKPDKIAPEAKEFLAEHRHQVGPKGHTTEIVLVVQDLSQVAAFATRLIEKTYISRKHNELGLKGRYVVGVFSGAIKGLNGPRSRELAVIQGAYKPEVWRFYKSHTKSEGGVVGNEQVADRRGVIWKRPLVMFGVPVAIIGIALGVMTIRSYFLGWGQPDEPTPVARIEQPATPASGVTLHNEVPGLVRAAAPSPVSVPVVVIPASKDWRLAAVIEVSPGEGVAVAMAGRRQRRIPFEHCRQDSVGEWECRLDGELVTAWSGQEPSNIAEQLVSGQTRALGYDKHGSGN